MAHLAAAAADPRQVGLSFSSSSSPFLSILRHARSCPCGSNHGEGALLCRRGPMMRLPDPGTWWSESRGRDWICSLAVRTEKLPGQCLLPGPGDAQPPQRSPPWASTVPSARVPDGWCQSALHGATTSRRPPSPGRLAAGHSCLRCLAVANCMGTWVWAGCQVIHCNQALPLLYVVVGLLLPRPFCALLLGHLLLEEESVVW
jgi:hypothetical protein